MNIYATIILAALITHYLLNLLGEFLNIAALEKKPPKEFEKLVDDAAYEKSQTYVTTTTRFGFVSETFGLGLILAFWFLKGFNEVDRIVRSMNLDSISSGLVYFGILLLLKMLFSLPFDLYSTFVIEERFGFNKTTVGVFFADMFKGIILSVLLGGALLAGIFFVLEKLGPFAWMYAWLATTGFTLLLQFLAPTFILPMFNKFTPLEEGELKEKLLQYTRSVDFPVSGIYIIDGSKRSTKSNAFFTGFGKNKRIALFDTLVEKQTIEELLAILAHEVGHYKKKHILKSMLLSVVHTGIIFYLLSIFLQHQGLFDAFYMEQTSIYAGLLFFGMLYTPIEMILSVLMNILSRKNEYEADAFASQTTRNPQSLITALKKLSIDNLSNLTPHPFQVFLHYSHPPVLERILALRGNAPI